MYAQRGFSLAEVLIAAAIAVVIGFFLLRANAAALQALSFQSARVAEISALQELESRWEIESASAWAIFTPPADVTGASNADGHEVDFFTRSGKGADSFWAYTYSAAAQSLSRYRYAAPGAAPTLDRTYAGITSFYARTYPVTALSDPSSKIYSPLYDGAALQNGAVRFFSANAPWIEGGNAITYVRVATAHESREDHLSTESAPSGFTIVLDYTPAPLPSPSLAIWPAYVAYTVSGQSFASTGQPLNMAMALNALLGGGIAQAAGCSALAFNDPGHTIPATPPPGWNTGESVAGDGCYDGKIWLSDPGYSGRLYDDPNQTSCTSANVVPAAWNSIGGGGFPDGPLNAQQFSGNTTPTNSCTLGFVDAKATPDSASATVSVYQYACSVIGQTCTLSVGGWPNDGPWCNPPNFGDPGGMNPGYNGTGSFTISPSPPPGTFTQNDTAATASFTRSGAGSVTITAYAQYVSYTYVNVGGRFECRMLRQNNLYQTWTIP